MEHLLLSFIIVFIILKMGSCNGKSNENADFIRAPDSNIPLKVWRRDGIDSAAAKALFSSETERLRNEGHSEDSIKVYIDIYKRGALSLRNEVVRIVKEDLVPDVCVLWTINWTH